MPNTTRPLVIEHNRRAYMAHEVDHQTYYAQFVTPRLFQAVSDVIGEDRIKGSTDPHFNDIPLGRWDGLAKGLAHYADEWNAVSASNASTERTGTPWHSLSDRVCVLKAAAREIRGH